jgi:hypothetical protein
VAGAVKDSGLLEATFVASELQFCGPGFVNVRVLSMT